MERCAACGKVRPTILIYYKYEICEPCWHKDCKDRPGFLKKKLNIKDAPERVIACSESLMLFP